MNIAKLSTIKRALLSACAIALISTIPGCDSVKQVGSMRIQSLDADPVAIDAKYTTAFYAHGGSVESSFILSDVPLEKLLKSKVSNGHILHVQMLWIPKPGSTPMDSSATNVSLRYIIMSNGELGLYTGAGFAIPQDKMGSDLVEIDLRSASLTLTDSTPGFVDLLTPAKLTGDFTATLNDQRTQQMRSALRRIINSALPRNRNAKADDNNAYAMHAGPEALRRSGYE